MNLDKYVSPKHLRQKCGSTPSALRRWAENGNIRFIRTPGNRRLYNESDVTTMFKPKNDKQEKKEAFIYARVSSSKQKEDLERQVGILTKHYPNHKLIRDIGSGLNYNRQGFKTLLDKCCSGSVSEVVVLYKDRLCRYGVELVEQIFDKTHVKFVVHSQCEVPYPKSSSEELAEDLLAVVTFFTAKNNGLRESKNKKRRRNALEIGKGEEGQERSVDSESHSQKGGEEERERTNEIEGGGDQGVQSCKKKRRKYTEQPKNPSDSIVPISAPEKAP